MRTLLLVTTTLALAGFAALAAAQPVPPGYFYGPPRFGPGFGYRRFGPWGLRPYRRSFGTGYYGRGTWTGGPVGGLPSRN